MNEPSTNYWLTSSDEVFLSKDEAEKYMADWDSEPDKTLIHAISYDFHKETVERLEAECLEYVEKYRQIKLANTEITRNDHVQFGKLMEERTSLRAQLKLAIETLEGCEKFVKKIAEPNSADPSRVDLDQRISYAMGFLMVLEKKITELKGETKCHT